MTRTYTVYFGEDALGSLNEAIAELEQDFVKRRPHIDEEAGNAMERRLQVLNVAAQLLGEPVPPSYGG